jgi:hypothetical protein
MVKISHFAIASVSSYVDKYGGYTLGLYKRICLVELVALI